MCKVLSFRAVVVEWKVEPFRVGLAEVSNSGSVLPALQASQGAGTFWEGSILQELQEFLPLVPKASNCSFKSCIDCRSSRGHCPLGRESIHRRALGSTGDPSLAAVLCQGHHVLYIQNPL